jgi:signal peptidase I
MRSKLLKVLVLAALVLLVGFAMLLFAAKPYRVATDSMRPALRAGDYMFVTKTPGTLRRGDIVSLRRSVSIPRTGRSWGGCSRIFSRRGSRSLRRRCSTAFGPSPANPRRESRLSEL